MLSRLEEKGSSLIRAIRLLGRLAAIASVLWLGAAQPGFANCTGCQNASFGPAGRFQALGDGLVLSGGDFNNDGAQDLVVAGTTTVRVLLGDGSGQFQAMPSLSLPGQANSVAVGDLNGDGRLDIAVAVPNPAGDALVFFGDGAGNLSAPLSLSPGGHPSSVVAADFNGDGKLDLAVGSWGFDPIRIFPGNGAGAFGAAVTVPVPSSPGILAAGDFNRDGVFDLMAGLGDGSVVLLLGQPGGGFQNASRISLDNFPTQDLVLGDFNGDGKLDAVVAVQYDKVALLLGHGDGGFDPPILQMTGAISSGLATADFNGDGRLDLVSAGEVFLADGFGGFTFSAMPPGRFSPVAADFDGDGLPDVASMTNGELYVSLGNGDGQFALPSAFPIAGGVRQVYSTDLDKDGKPDLLTLADSFALGAFLNDGSGGFAPPVTTPITLYPEIVVGDFDEDTFPDVVELAPYSSYAIGFRRGLGDGHFDSAVWRQGVFAAGMVAGDFNGDTHLDVAVQGGGSLILYYGDGKGHFAAPVTSIALPEFGVLVATDLNGDGKPDLVLEGSNHNNVYGFVGDGQGGFAGIGNIFANFSAVEIADVNGDGKADVIESGYQTITVWLCTGTGFQSPKVVPGLPNAGQIVAADFNGDGKTDVAVGFQGLTILVGDGTGNFQLSPTGYASPGTPIGTADFDSDLKTDIFGYTADGTSVFVLRNTNCEPRRLELSTEMAPCGSAGVPFVPQPVVKVQDDGGNVLACDSGNVAASIVPGTGTGGASLNGNTTVAASSGVATFSGLSVDLPGRGYRLAFAHSGSRPTVSRAFSQSLPAPAIVASAQACTVGSATYDGGAGYDSYSWTLDGAVRGSSRYVTLAGAAAGPHTLALTVVQTGCQATASMPISVQVSPPAPTASNNGPVSFGSTLQLSAGAGSPGSFEWTGPNGFTSNQQNPAIPNATPQASGRYQVVFRQGGCGSAPAFTDAVVVSAPVCGSCNKPSIRGLARAVRAGGPGTGPFVLADFDGDGAQDLVAIGQGIEFLRGDGAGGFAPPVTTTFSGGSGTALAAADFDGDGVLDLAIVQPFSYGVAVKFGTPSGVFGPSTVLLADQYSLYGLAAADLNRDGKPDIVVTNRQLNNITVLINSGNGSFAAPVTLPAGTEPVAIVVRDFNGDNWPDIACANHGSRTVTVTLQDGLGGFLAPAEVSVPGTPFSLAAGDITGDGIVDFAVGQDDYPDGRVTLLKGLAGGSFTHLRTFTTTLTGAIVVADMNGDGKEELITPGRSGISVWRSLGDGLFAAPLLLPINEQAGLYQDLGLVVGDFNRDGFADILSWDRETLSHVLLFPGDGSGGFDLILPEYLGGIYEGLAAFVTTDLNGDGRLDRIVAEGSGYAHDVQVFIADSTGNFGPPVILSQNPPFSDAIGDVIVGDVNGGGIPDIIMVGEIGGVLNVFPGLGGGNFGGPIGTDPGQRMELLSWGDLNGDGRLDLVMKGSINYPQGLFVLLGNASSGFSAPQLIAGSPYPISAEIADFNGDGKADLAVVDQNDQTHVRIFPGDGFGGFSAPAAFPIGASAPSGAPGAIRSADFNSDGKRDLAIAAQDGIRVLLGAGAGNFGAPARFGPSVIPTTLAIGDFNGDGKPDIAGDLQQGIVGVMIGDGQGGFGTMAEYRGGYPGKMLAAMDLDGDGRFDLVVPDAPTASVVMAPSSSCVPAARRDDESLLSAAGAGFPVQPVVDVLDDGGNVVACDNRAVSAARVPGAGPAGAVLGGTTTVSAAAGVAAFTNLSLDTAGTGYQLEFHHPLAASTRSAVFSVGTLPASPLAGNGGPACEGDSLQLTASTVPGATYRWTGPNGFSSSRQNPVISNVTTAMGGQYSVTAKINGCTSPPTATIVTIKPKPSAPAASNNGPVCANQTLQLNAATVPNGVYAWTGPNGFTSSEQNPQIPFATTLASGQYKVTVTVDGCKSAFATTTATVRALPSAAILGPSSVCANRAGNRATIASAQFGAVYQWSIINGSITSGQGSSTVVFTAEASGSAQLSVAVTGANGCASQSEGSQIPIVACVAEPQSLVVDGTANPQKSDGNGIFEPGETVIVRPAWKNTGQSPLGLTGAATSFTGPQLGSSYTIGDSTANYGAVAAGATSDCGPATGDCYELGLSSLSFRQTAHWDATFTETLSDSDAPAVWVLHIGQSFNDVPKTHVFYPFIERLLHNGVTTGCSATSYCPEDFVFRLQMAVFLARTQAGGDDKIPTAGTAQGNPYDCKAGGTSLFSDIPPGDPFCRHVHYIYKTGVTTGCEAGKYCPNPNVTRAQMALFVARAVANSDAAVPVSYGPDPVTGRSYSCDAGSPNLHFTDVTTSDIFCRHIHYLWARDVISGFPDGSYGPALEVTRGAMAKFLANALHLRLYGP